MTATYNLIWKRGANTMNLPVGLATSVKSQYESDTLVCDCGAKPAKKGEKVVRQKYECQACGKEFSSIGMIKNRFSYANQVVYNSDEKHDFLKTALDREIEVRSEVPLESAVAQHVELFNATNTLEIFSNDSEKFKQAVLQIWSFLNKKGIALLAEVNYRGDNFVGYIIAASTGKLVLVKLRDEKLIKSSYSTSGIPVSYKPLNFVSVKAQKEEQFIRVAKTGKLPKPKAKIAMKPVISEKFFAEAV
jgi:transcription elongation factor Elf1